MPTLSGYKRLSVFADRLVPGYIRENYPQFVEFIRGFLEWLEVEYKDTQGNIIGQNPYRLLSFILDENNIDTALTTYWNEHKSKYAVSFPDNIDFPKKILFGILRPFYQTKGTEAAIKFLYRLFFGEDVEIFYPSDFILAVSGGEWYKPTILLFSDAMASIGNEPLRTDQISTLPYNLLDLIGAEITGNNSGATAMIDGFGSATYGHATYFTMYIVNVKGKFQVGEPLNIKNGIGNTGLSVQTISIAQTTFQQQTQAGTQTITLSPNDVIQESIGQYRTIYNTVSGISVMQDNYYFQNASYVIRSSQPFEHFNKYIKKIAHVSGLKPFGTYSINLDKIQNISSANIGRGYDGILINKITPINMVGKRNITFGISKHIVASLTYGRFDKQKGLFPYNHIYRVGDIPPNLPNNTFTTKKNEAFPYAMGSWVRLIKPIYMNLVIPVSPFTAGRLQSSYSLRIRTFIGTISNYQINQFTDPNLVINVAHPASITKIINNAQPVSATIGNTTTGAINSNKFVPGTPYYTMPIGAIANMQIRQFNNPNANINFANVV